MPKNTRRDNGEGSQPIQRADGRWQISIRVSNTTTGKPIRKTFTKKTRAEVVAAAKKYRNGLSQGVLADPTRTTLAGWLDYWLPEVATPNISERTARDYRQQLNRWVYTSPTAGIPLEKLEPLHIHQVHARMRAESKSESTILKLHRVLSKSLNDAVKLGAIGSNPATRISSPKAADFDPEVLTVEQARALIRSTHGDKAFGPSFTIALALGLRQGERLALCWKDVDLAAGTLKIRHSLAHRPWAHGCGGRCGKAPHKCPDRVGGGYYFKSPKSKQGRRTWVLPAQMVEVFERQKALQDRWKVEEGPGWAGFVDADGVRRDLVFTRRDGGLVLPSQDRRAWTRFLVGEGVDPVRLHDARHTAATVLLQLGVTPRVVMDLMGWSSMSMLTRYQHVLDGMKSSVAEQIGGALFDDPEPVDGPIVDAPSSAGGVVSLDDFRKRRSG